MSMTKRMLKVVLFLVLSLPVVASSALADDVVGVGDQAPSLELQNQNEEPMTLATLSGEKGLVVAFVRSLDWCPYCKSQVVELNKSSEQIEATGYNVATVSYDAPDVLKSFADKFDVGINLLSDPGSETIKAFGILNEEYDADHFAYGVPHPHIFVVSKEGTVLEVLAEEGYKERPTIESILKSLNSQ